MNDLPEFFRGKKVLITGHSGFKGAWLSEILLGFGAKVAGLALKPHTRPSLFNLLRLKERTRNHFLDIRNFKNVSAVMEKEKPEIVFHLAAQPLVLKSYDDPLETFSTNVMGTVNLLQTVKESSRVRAAVIITTDKVYDNKESSHAYREADPLGGHDPYSSSKAAADLIAQSYLKSFSLPLAIARAGNVLGGGDWGQDRIVPDIVRAVYENGAKLLVRNPDAIRPWQHVLDPLCGYLLLARGLYEGKKDLSGAWNFGPNDESHQTVRKLLENVLTGFGGREYDISADASANKYEAQFLKLDIAKAGSFLNWRPRLDFETSVKLTVDWYKKFYEKKNSAVELTGRQIKSFFSNEKFFSRGLPSGARRQAPGLSQKRL